MMRIRLQNRLTEQDRGVLSKVNLSSCIQVIPLGISALEIDEM